eukprot:767424-Hanusia_phi.AAC.5
MSFKHRGFSSQAFAARAGAARLPAWGIVTCLAALSPAVTAEYFTEALLGMLRRGVRVRPAPPGRVGVFRHDCRWAGRGLADSVRG